MKRALLAGVAVLVVSSACGLEGTETNEIGLIYSGGVVEDKAYKGQLFAGATAKSVGLGSKVYKYRTDQRSIIAGPDGSARDIAPVQFVSSDDTRMATDLQMYFKLNQNEDTLRAFHENLGVKTEAWTDAGWDQMLREYFIPQIERAIEAAGLAFPWRDLYASEEARVKFQNDAADRAKTAITEVIGGEYFCGPSYTGAGSKCGTFTMTVGKPYPVNGKIVDAIEAEQTAVTETRSQEQENARIAAQVAGERAKVELYGTEYLIQQQRNEALKEICGGGTCNVFLGDSDRITIPAR